MIGHGVSESASSQFSLPYELSVRFVEGVQVRARRADEHEPARGHERARLTVLRRPDAEMRQIDIL